MLFFGFQFLFFICFFLFFLQFLQIQKAQAKNKHEEQNNNPQREEERTKFKYYCDFFCVFVKDTQLRMKCEKINK